MVWERLLLIGLAGAAGAVARYLCSRTVTDMTGATFPWGTMTVNMLGCLVFGLVWGISEYRDWFSDRTRVALLIGFLGAFTTFSSFAYETVALIRDNQWWWAAFNVIVQNVVGLAAVLLGISLSRPL